MNLPAQRTIRFTTTLGRQPAGVSDAVATALMGMRPTLGEQIHKGMVWPVSACLVPPGTIERNPRAGKLVRVKDLL
jgi:hypothetical protein